MIGLLFSLLLCRIKLNQRLDVVKFSLSEFVSNLAFIGEVDRESSSMSILAGIVVAPLETHSYEFEHDSLAPEEEHNSQAPQQEHDSQALDEEQQEDPPTGRRQAQPTRKKLTSAVWQDFQHSYQTMDDRSEVR